LSPVARRGEWALAFVASLCVAQVASAAGGGESGSSDLLERVFNFALLGGVLFVVARKPVIEFMKNRRSGIESQLSETAALQAQAEEQHARLEAQLAELDVELENIRAGARERAEREAEQILADARAAAERIERDAVTVVDQEVRRGRASLREEASELAVELAADLLRAQVGPQDRERLLDEFIERVAEAPASDLPEVGN